MSVHDCDACGNPYFVSDGCFCGCGKDFVWVNTTEKLKEAVEELLRNHVMGIDIESTLRGKPCLLQIAGGAENGKTYLIDLRAGLDPELLKPLMEKTPPLKLAHNASFENRMLKSLGVTLQGVVDTLKLSRERRPGVKGHSLQAVCERELQITLDKKQQKSDWARRPLTVEQIKYAAQDAQVLLDVYERFL